MEIEMEVTMVIKYELSISELKALLELIQTLCKKSGLDECITRALFRKLNEKSFK